MIRTRGSKVNTAKWYNSGSAIVNRTVPTLYHDFANQRYYDTALGETAFPYTSVHRASNAMQFDSQGRLVWAPANLIVNSAMAGAIVGTTAPTNWTIGNGADCIWSVTEVGTNYAIFRLQGTAIGQQYPNIQIGNAASSPTASNGESYTLSATILRTVNSPGSSSYLNILGRDAGLTGVAGQEVMLPIPAGVESRYSTTFQFTSASVARACARYMIRVDAGVTVDEYIKISFPQFERTGPDSPKNYVQSFTSSFYYGPRFDYDPFTHEPLGLLVEQSRSNDVAKGLSLNSSVGTFQDGTGSNGPTYLGGWSSARYTGNGVSNPHFYFGGSITPSASTSRSVSAIVAYVDTQYLQLTTSANWPLDAANTYMNIDAIAGTITATGSAVTDTFIKKLANNVYHIGFTCVSSAAPTGGAGAIVGAINTSTAGRLPIFTHTGSFDVIYLFNGAGVGWNSITPTFGTAATRADDVVSMSTGSWLNTAAGTVYVEAKRITKSSTSQTFTNIGNSGGSTERNQFRISSGNTSHIITVGNVVQVTSAIGSAVSLNANFKAAYRYRAGEQRLVEDGTLGASLGNIPALPATQDTIHVGGLYNTSEKLNGWIKQIRYYNTASPSDAQLQTLTT